MIDSAQRYDIKGKAYIETPKKYYFSDLGLRNARINFRQFEQTHSMENVIYNELRRQSACKKESQDHVHRLPSQVRIRSAIQME